MACRFCSGVSSCEPCGLKSICISGSLFYFFLNHLIFLIYWNARGCRQLIPEHTWQSIITDSCFYKIFMIFINFECNNCDRIEIPVCNNTTYVLLQTGTSITYGGRDSSVGIATRYGLDSSVIESRWGRDFPHPSRPALGSTQPPVQWVPGPPRG